MEVSQNNRLFTLEDIQKTAQKRERTGYLFFTPIEINEEDKTDILFNFYDVDHKRYLKKKGE